MYYALPLQVQTYERLKQMILHEELVHGAIYSETRTAQLLGVSRTPIRDAIQRLAQEGYVDVIPSKGFRIHEMTMADLTQTCQLRTALEGYCVVRLALERQTERAQRALRQLRAVTDEQQIVAEGSRDLSAFAELDQQFHTLLIAYPQNDAFRSVFDGLHYRMRQQTLRSLEAPDRMEAALAEHREILDCIASGDVGRCYAAASAHLSQAKLILAPQTGE